jgi:ubiquinone/menaquinone biosynthesis C-methylase UbiE
MTDSLAVFDEVAKTYDLSFSNTEVGKRQRQEVWDFLEEKQSSKKHEFVLEINCGTGIDARWWHEKGHEVIATDASEGMLTEAINRNQDNRIQFIQSAFHELNDKIKHQKFSVIFSNFGGLNCIEEKQLHRLPKSLSLLLEEKGKLFLVIMGRKCLWEILYFSLKLDFKKAFRRFSTKGANANLGKTSMHTWYYSPNEIKRLFGDDFRVLHQQPIGLFIPPSYLETFFHKRKNVLNFLSTLEKILGKFPFLSDFGDHYIITLEKRS